MPISFLKSSSILMFTCFIGTSHAQNSDCSIIFSGDNGPNCSPEPAYCPVSPSPLLEGYGTNSQFGGGAGSEVCSVTNLNNSGAGSFRSCIEDRTGPTGNPVPRTVNFDVAGTILLEDDIKIRQPYLTIDGLSAPEPGVTIAKSGNGESGETRLQTWPSEQTCAHDVLIQGLRFKGVWKRNTSAHSQNASTFGIDGEDFTECLKNIAVWRNTFIDGQDISGGYWGSVTDTTFAYNFVLYNFHPQQISHSETTNNQERERFSVHHNIYTYAHERIPNIRGNVWDLNLEQNIFHKWDAFGFSGGYATKFRCRNSGCPMRINLIENHWTSGGQSLSNAIDFEDGASKTEVYMGGNIIPNEETDMGLANTPFPRTDSVTLFNDNQLEEYMFPYVGHPFPSNEERAVLDEVISQVKLEIE